MSEKRAEHLIALGNFREAADYLAGRTLPTHLERVLKVWVEFELGDARQAYAHATALLKTVPDNVSEAYCLAIAGRALGQSGSPHAGLGLLKKAITLASRSNPNFHAQLIGIFTNCLVSWFGIEPALVELPKVRQAATRTGDRRALVEYHIANARIAVLRGRPQTALNEIETCYNLLGDAPYSDLLWRLREAQSIAALQDGDVRLARAYADECLQLARESRSKRRIANTLGNLANIATVLGEFDRAKRLLDECLPLMDHEDPGRLAALSTGLEIALATGDDAFQSSILREGHSSMSGGAREPSFYRLWFEVNRARCLLRTGEYARVTELIEAVSDEVTRLGHKELLDRFRLLAAETCCLRGDLRTAVRRIGEICADRNHVSLVVTADVLRVSALMAEHKRHAAAYIAASARLLTANGLLGPRTDAEFTAKTLGFGAGSIFPTEHLPPVLANVGVILRLGRHPKLLGQELLSLLRESDEHQAAFLVEESEQGRNVIGYTDTTTTITSVSTDLRISLGATGRFDYWLHAPQLPAVSSRLIWNGIEQIAKAARALAQHPQDEELFSPDVSEEPPTMQFGMLIAGEKSSAVLEATKKVATSTFTVLITGETGTGKELLARALHDASPRSEKPFTPFNCSAVSRDMLDAQLFGYRKGAFTGANEAFQGVIRGTAGGTLFLDEIGEITPEVQPKLLRFLESGEIHPLGEPRPIHVDVRIVAATNADLEKLVGEGRFREDLFYRLNVVRLQVPPLRERREEIPPLVQHFLDKFSRESHKNSIRVADETMEYLILYNWPGNVRQLANEIRRMLALAESNAVLMPEHLSHAIASSRRTIPATERTLAPTEFIVRMDQPMSAAMEHLERSMIQYALKLTGGRVEDAADQLGLSRKGLYLKRQRLQIDVPTDERAAVHQ
jgi:DNA-binding NtrC family response regulator/tetratricopeptide (TPR) repeat protein